MFTTPNLISFAERIVRQKLTFSVLLYLNWPIGDCHSLDSVVYAQHFDHAILVFLFKLHIGKRMGSCFLKQTQTDAISASELSYRVDLIPSKTDCQSMQSWLRERKIPMINGKKIQEITVKVAVTKWMNWLMIKNVWDIVESGKHVYIEKCDGYIILWQNMKYKCVKENR